VKKKNRTFLDPRRNGFFDHNSQKSNFFLQNLVFVIQHKNSLSRLSKNAVVTLVKSLRGKASIQTETIAATFIRTRENNDNSIKLKKKNAISIFIAINSYSFECVILLINIR
jgi:hypothetical protein